MATLGAGFSEAERPNKRLKLAGALVLKEAVVTYPDGHRTFVHYSCAGKRLARSLSAIR